MHIEWCTCIFQCILKPVLLIAIAVAIAIATASVSVSTSTRTATLAMVIAIAIAAIREHFSFFQIAVIACMQTYSNFNTHGILHEQTAVAEIIKHTYFPISRGDKSL